METIYKPVNDRVRDNTSDKTNRKIDWKIEDSVRNLSHQDNGAVMSRLEKLNKEWDIERALELNASLIALGGVVLAATVSRKWLLLPALVTGFLAQHAIQGWCPPLPVLRKLGIRTQKEIDAERYALLDMLEDKPIE